MATSEIEHVNPLAVSFLGKLNELDKLIGEAKGEVARANGTLTSTLVKDIISKISQAEFGVRITGMAASKSLDSNSQPVVSSAVTVQEELDQMVEEKSAQAAS